MLREQFWSVFWASVALVITPLYANAASFDCSRATLPLDATICASPKLSSLDSDLGAAYSLAILHATDQEAKEALKSDQRAWLKQTRGACTDEPCLIITYEDRIEALRARVPQATVDVNVSTVSGPTPSDAGIEAASRPPLQPPSPSSLGLQSSRSVETSAPTVTPGTASHSIPREVDNDGKMILGLSILAILIAMLIWLLRKVWGKWRRWSKQAKEEFDDLGGQARADVKPTPKAVEATKVTDERPIGKKRALFVWTGFKSLYLREQIAIFAIPAALIISWPLGLLCLVGYFAVGVHKRCPSCEVLFARVTIDSEVLKQESAYETVTRRDQVRAKTDDVFSNIVEGGKHVGNIIRQEQVHVTHTTSRIYYKCSECGHRWSKLKVSTSQ